jgi:hypothetical protein
MGRGPNIFPVKSRPDFWSPEWLLEWRAGHPDTPIQAQYELWAGEWGTSVSSIKAEIRIWKKTIEGFSQQLAAIDPGSLVPQRASGHTLDDFTPGWMERFCAEYRSRSSVGFHHRKNAADAAGLAWETIRAKLNTKNANYDHVFAGLCEEIESETTEDARSGIKTALEIARDQDDARTLGKLSLDVLERREPGTWARNQKVTVEGTVFHAPANVRQAALGQAAQVSRGVVAVPNPALPEHVDPVSVEIIEAEYVIGGRG